jgi:hypothetical protein
LAGFVVLIKKRGHTINSKTIKKQSGVIGHKRTGTTSHGDTGKEISICQRCILDMTDLSQIINKEKR